MTRVAGALALVCLIGLAPASHAEEPAGAPRSPVEERGGMPDAPPDAAGTDSAAATPRRSAPFRVLLRSALVPAWGQAYNGKLLKAAVVIAGEGYLVYRAWDEFEKEKDAIDRLGAAQGFPEDDPDRPFAIAAAQSDRREHMNRKVTFIWLAVVAHLLQAADAYVDAHLSTFEADFGPEETGVGVGSAPRLALRLTARF